MTAIKSFPVLAINGVIIIFLDVAVREIYSHVAVMEMLYFRQSLWVVTLENVLQFYCIVHFGSFFGIAVLNSIGEEY